MPIPSFDLKLIALMMSRCDVARRKSGGSVALLNFRYAASSAFKDIKVGQVPKSRRHSSEPHDLTAAWAKQRAWRVFIRVFVAHRHIASDTDGAEFSVILAERLRQRGNRVVTNKQLG